MLACLGHWCVTDAVTTRLLMGGADALVRTLCRRHRTHADIVALGRLIRSRWAGAAAEVAARGAPVPEAAVPDTPVPAPPEV